MLPILYLATGIAGFICLTNIFANVNLKTSRAINKFLITLFIFQSIRFFANGLTPFLPEISQYKIRVWMDILNVLITPCFYLYFVDLIDEEKFRINRLWHLLWAPVSLVMIYMGLKLSGVLEKDSDIAIVMFSSSLVLYGVYFVLILRLLYRHVWKRSSELMTVNRQNKVIRNWTIFMYSIMVGMLVRSFLTFSMNDFTYYGESEPSMLWLGAILWMALFVKVMITPEILYGYQIFNKIKEKPGIQELVLSEIWSAEKPVVSIENERDKKLQEKVAPQINNYLQKIEDKLLQSDLLKNPDFGIDELTAETGIPSSHLNFIFRYHSRESFNDCKKLLRIREAVKILEDESQQALTFEAIASQVGFSSYSTFYISFKNIMGITPMEMRNRLTGKGER
jgi:AraC-like DNA-binding protein